MGKKNANLNRAKVAKNDEFYTQYRDIENEMRGYLKYDKDVFRDKVILLPCDDPEWSNFTQYFALNFKSLGLKKLISTSYAHASKNVDMRYSPSDLEVNSPEYNDFKSIKHGKYFELDRDINGDVRIDINDIRWKYLEGDGDFRSDEITALRDEADVIITNPPFSLFREFLAWIMEGGKKFSIICNKNCVSYKDVFPLIRENKIWSGVGKWGSMLFETKHDNIDKIVDGLNMKSVAAIWMTNLEHGRRHEPLELMTLSENKRFNLKLKDKNAYKQYDNYNAIEVPYTDAIPKDYDGVMGVPISFLGKYNPEQFEILGISSDVKDGLLDYLIVEDWGGKLDRSYMNGKCMYARLLIRHRRND